MPLTSRGLKVKELLSASRMNGRYLCLDGKQAIIPLEAEPSSPSSHTLMSTDLFKRLSFLLVLLSHLL